MRIDLFNTQASQIGGQPNSNKVKGQNVAASETDSSAAHTTLTSGSGSIGTLVSAAMSSPDIRHEKVQALQQQVSSGQYKLDPDKIAGAMIDEHA